RSSETSSLIQFLYTPMPSFHLLVPKQLPHPNRSSAPRSLAETGQSLALIAIMFLVLLAFVGLAADGAVLYISYAQLRRAVDAAALGVAGQLREVQSDTSLNRTAQEII